ncbi:MULTISPECIES: hypothetical protein [Paracoccus]|mgnify:CR=1 FL=1|uniref:hypothetical protein n=1 Tax=Paracoccus TaxID=265 RepID=UPI000DF77E91|nr:MULTISPECIES: hypothetical protein [Paracoccus]MCJ1901112.1 hypothetical protein [Paracoccus versutus]MDF3906225.1 hypothetical protein [Paracoccus sp. AS002]RDD71982.1 hypothetical protein DVR11_08255 [Paracoccus versutus]
MMIRHCIFISATALFWATAAGAQDAATETPQPLRQGAGSAAQAAPGLLDCAIWADRERLAPAYRQLAQTHGRDTAESWLRQQTTAYNLHAARMGKAAAPCPA